MKLEQQVCALEQAKRLKELGIAQRCFFAWGNEGSLYEGALYYPRSDKAEPKTWENFYAAFTVAELGQMLPQENLNNCKRYPYQPPIIVIGYADGACYLIDRSADGDAPAHDPDSDDWEGSAYPNEAQARAALLIHLLETSAVTAEEVNNRLNA